MKGQDKIPENKWNGERQPSRKIIQKNDSKDDPESQKNNGGKDWEDTRNVCQRPRTKEQTNTDEEYTRKNQ